MNTAENRPRRGRQFGADQRTAARARPDDPGRARGALDVRQLSPAHGAGATDADADVDVPGVVAEVVEAVWLWGPAATVATGPGGAPVTVTVTDPFRHHVDAVQVTPLRDGQAARDLEEFLQRRGVAAAVAPARPDDMPCGPRITLPALADAKAFARLLFDQRPGTHDAYHAGLGLRAAFEAHGIDTAGVQVTHAGAVGLGTLTLRAAADLARALGGTPPPTPRRRRPDTATAAVLDGRLWTAHIPWTHVGRVAGVLRRRLRTVAPTGVVAAPACHSCAHRRGHEIALGHLAPHAARALTAALTARITDVTPLAPGSGDAAP
ncbi:hypothetical protein [Streptomyces jumonjinensis]|uniref:hypothetical protein n=1 Tax=Streptomyces jumonjinensis TaxID=1945 RepID=UPI00379B516F